MSKLESGLALFFSLSNKYLLIEHATRNELYLCHNVWVVE